MSNQSRWIAVVAALLVAGTVVWLNWPSYGKTSSHGYQLVTALYSACTRQDEEKVAAVAELTTQAAESGKVSEREARWLNAIVDDAQAGRWQTAAAESRELMDAQVEY